MRDLTNKEIRKKFDTLEGSVEGLSKDIGNVNMQQTKINKELTESVTDWATDFDITPSVMDVLDTILTIAQGAVNGEDALQIILQIVGDITGLNMVMDFLDLLNWDTLQTLEKIDDYQEEFDTFENFYNNAFRDPDSKNRIGSYIDVSLEANNGAIETASDEMMYYLGYYGGANYGARILFDEDRLEYYQNELPGEKTKLENMQKRDEEGLGEAAKAIYDLMLRYIEPRPDAKQSLQLEEGKKPVVRDQLDQEEIDLIEADKEVIIDLIKEGLKTSTTDQEFYESPIWEEIRKNYGVHVRRFQAFSLADSDAYKYAQTYHMDLTTPELLQQAAIESVFGLGMTNTYIIRSAWEYWGTQYDLVAEIQDYINYYAQDLALQTMLRDSREWIPGAAKEYISMNGEIDQRLISASQDLYHNRDNDAKYPQTTKFWYEKLKAQGGNPPSYGHMALGSQYAPGGFMEVGEHGPEIAYIPEGAKVFTNSYSKQLAQEAIRWIKEEYEKNQLEKMENQNGKPLMREDLDEIADYVIEKLVRELEATAFNMP